MDQPIRIVENDTTGPLRPLGQPTNRAQNKAKNRPLYRAQIGPYRIQNKAQIAPHIGRPPRDPYRALVLSIDGAWYLVLGPFVNPLLLWQSVVTSRGGGRGEGEGEGGPKGALLGQKNLFWGRWTFLGVFGCFVWSQK